jgi:hypothetical protein
MIPIQWTDKEINKEGRKEGRKKTTFEILAFCSAWRPSTVKFIMVLLSPAQQNYCNVILKHATRALPYRHDLWIISIKTVGNIIRCNVLVLFLCFYYLIHSEMYSVKQVFFF